MRRTVEAQYEGVMRAQLLAFLDEYCRGMTLADVREWYADAVCAEGTLHIEGGCS